MSTETTTNPASSAQTPRSFQIRRSPYNYTLESLTDGRKFTANNSTHDPDKPDLSLYQGADEQGPILAACRFKHLSRDVQICQGDPTTDNVTWETLERSSLLRTQYTWVTAGERSLTWKKTQAVSKSQETGSRSLKLVDEETGEILALFTSATTWAMGGTLEIRANFEEKFDLMVIMACITLFEKAHRNSITAGGASFGAGSGGV